MYQQNISLLILVISLLILVLYRTPGRKIKIIPPNVEVSPAASETSFDRTSVDCDPGCLTPGNDSAKTAGKRESVSEPLSAPPGKKIIN
jgi:hypothetical protein